MAQAQRSEPALTPVEQGVGDIGPSRTSLRTPTGDLQQDTSFEQVYVGADGKFYRVSGAIYAQFDRSVYVPTGWGAAPVIPPGTVFHIGAPPSLMGVPRSMATLASADDDALMHNGMVSERIDDRVYATGVSTDDVADRHVPAPAPPEVSDKGTMSHEPTRQQRLHDIASRVRTGS